MPAGSCTSDWTSHSRRCYRILASILSSVEVLSSLSLTVSLRLIRDASGTTAHEVLMQNRERFTQET